MLSLGSNILSLIVKELDVRDSVQLHRCCWYLYKKVAIAANEQEQRWLKLIQTKSITIEIMYEPLTIDNLKWFVTMVLMENSQLISCFNHAAIHDSIVCAEYLWKTCTVETFPKLTTTPIWYTIRQQHPRHRFLKVFENRLRDKYARGQYLHYDNAMDAIKYFGGVLPPP